MVDAVVQFGAYKLALQNLLAEIQANSLLVFWVTYWWLVAKSHRYPLLYPTPKTNIVEKVIKTTSDMTLRDFNRLTEMVKGETVDLWGDKIAEKVIPGYQVKVYHLFDFYVEVYLDTKEGKIKRFRACNIRETVVTY